jgi:hypothetical protein
MNLEIGNIFIDKIKDLPFLDKYTGIVKTLTMKDPAASTATSKKVFPVACNADLDECQAGKRYLDYCPDNSKKSILYLEDNGVIFMGKDQQRTNWKARFDLICWLNLPALGVSSCSYSAIAIMGILSKMPLLPFNQPDSIYQKVNIQVMGEKPKNVSPFLKYSYDETINQFLMFPYDYFVLPIEVEFMIDWRCLKVADLNPAIACLTK